MSDEPSTNLPPVTNAAVETFGLTRHYGNLTALNALDLTVNKGDLFGFIGSNGAGKTTTLRILSTFLSPSPGPACGSAPPRTPGSAHPAASASSKSR